MTGAPPEISDIGETDLRALPAGVLNDPFDGLPDAAEPPGSFDLTGNIAAPFPIQAIGRFLTCFPRYHAADKPIRGERVRFRGFLAFPVRFR